MKPRMSALLSFEWVGEPSFTNECVQVHNQSPLFYGRTISRWVVCDE